MSLSVNIRKQLGGFTLETQFSAGDERLALLGASGSGKSITLKCIAGILRPDEGHIELDGTVLYDSAAGIDLPPQRRRLGYLFQQYALFPNMTVRQNIAVAVADKSRRADAADKMLRAFHLVEVADLKPRQLSGGQQQRTALARILVTDPRAILLDEPFSALDGYLKYQVEYELTETLKTFPGAVIWVSHDRGEVWRNCARVCAMDRGRSFPVRETHDFFRAPVTETAARISGCKNYAAIVPDGTRVFVPDWDISLECGTPIPADTALLGLRSHHLRPAAGDEPNRIPCAVVRVIDDVFSTVVLLRPLGAAEGVPPLRMELPKEIWAALAGRSSLTVTADPQDIMLLRKGMDPHV